jgi:hypothetical protein
MAFPIRFSRLPGQDGSLVRQKGAGESLPREQKLKKLRNHPKELFGAGRHFPGASGGEVKEGHARVGLKPASDVNRTATPADSLFKGDHHVRTLYGEGTARDLLRAV